jgi:hypothetical protein
LEADRNMHDTGEILQNFCTQTAMKSCLAHFDFVSQEKVCLLTRARQSEKHSSGELFDRSNPVMKRKQSADFRVDCNNPRPDLVA